VFVLTLKPLIGLCLVRKCEIGYTGLDGEKVIACAQAQWYMVIKLNINMASTVGNASTQTQRTRLERARPEAFQGSWTLTSLSLEMDFLMAAARESVVESRRGRTPCTRLARNEDSSSNVSEIGCGTMGLILLGNRLSLVGQPYRGFSASGAAQRAAAIGS
jgi:hypothetical protein